MVLQEAEEEVMELEVFMVYIEVEEALLATFLHRQCDFQDYVHV